MNGKASSYKTTCSYCGVGCGIIIHKSPDGKLSLEGDKDNPVNRGMLCSKGRNLLYVVNDTSDRLLQPQIRQNIEDDFQNTTWDTALDKAANKIKQTISDHGPDSIAFYVSGQCLTEEYYIANKLVKGFIGTNNIDTNSRLCMSSAVMGYKLSLGDDCVPASYDDIELADCFLISGANPAWCHPILFRRLENHKEKKPDTKIIIIDPRVTDSCSIADIHLQLKPGTDITLTNAIAKCLIDSGKIDFEFITKNTNGFHELAKDLAKFDLDKAAEFCDVPLEKIIEAASLIGNAKGFISLWAMGLNQSSEGVNKNLSLLNLSLLTGKIGKPGSGPLSLTGQPNAMGGREVGGMATLLAAHHDLANRDHRIKIQSFWNSKEIAAKPGFTATEIIDALEAGKIKVVWIICTNPLVSLPNLLRTEKAFKKAEMIIVQDISSKSDTLEYAHIILPAAGWLEKDGTMTNSDRRISYLNKVVSPPGMAKPDSEILCSFANKMGIKGFDYKNSEEIFNEYRQLTSGTTIDISALSYHSLKTEGSKQWPVSLKNPNGTNRLFSDGKFYTKDQKAVIHSVIPKPLLENICNEFPFALTTGRIRDQWHTMTRTGKVEKLNNHISKPELTIHPMDAAKLEITNGEVICIYNNRGSVELPVSFDQTLKQGTLFIPMHWGKILDSKLGRANNITSSHIDPVSKQPEFKYATVNLKKIDKAQRRIIIIGAGAAAYSFITNHRKNNKKDRITVFSKEKNAFYNRIQLPEYINDKKDWSCLLKTNKEELDALNIDIQEGNYITNIDTKSKFVQDKNNKSYSFDKLILATGSKPIVPDNAFLNIPGVFTVRTRNDADKIKNYIKNTNSKSATVIGGGVLGLEIADSLIDMQLDVSMLVRGNKLMSKQLDTTAAKLLAKEISEKGIHIYFNKSLQNIDVLSNKAKSLVLSNSLRIQSDLLIFAIGTQPNIELAKNAELKINKGIVVNEFMQTSNSDIYAIGEIAEFKGALYGITLAAEEQALACANYFAGNYFDHYKGTTSINILKCSGIYLCSLGIIDSDDPEIEEVILLDYKSSYYKKCLVKNDRLIGAILMGDTAEFGTYKTLIANKTELGDERNTLLRSSEKQAPVIGNLVCSCNRVGKGNLENYINNGCSDFEGLMLLSKAGTGCGSCKPEIKRILAQNTVAISQ